MLRLLRLALGCALPASGEINKPKGILFEVRISQPEKRQVLAGGAVGARARRPRLLNLLQESEFFDQVQQEQRERHRQQQQPKKALSVEHSRRPLCCCFT